MPQGITAFGRSGVLIVAVSAFAIAIVSAGVAYGLWALRRGLRRRSAHKNQHILAPPPRIPSPESEALELGNAFRRGDAPEHESFVILPHNLASYLPATPPRAHVSGSSPFMPPGLPPCKPFDSARTPVLVLTNTSRTHRSVEVLLEYADTFISAKRWSQRQSSCRVLEPIAEDRTAGEELITGLALGLKMLRDETDKESSKEIAVYSTVENMNLTESAKGAPQDRLAIMHSGYSGKSPSKVPSPPLTPVLPTLVLTSASMQRGLSVGKRRAEKDFLSSPPKTPTLVLTSPSIHCGLDLDPEERLGLWKDDLQGWGDVLELEDCEEAKVPSRGSLIGIPKQLETPPQTPTFLQTPPLRSPVALAPTLGDEQGPLFLWPTEAPPESTQTDSEESKSLLDYATFHARLAAYNLTHKRVKVDEPIGAKGQFVDTLVVSSASSTSHGFDYDRLLARRRVAAVSDKSRSFEWPSLTIQVPAPARHAGKTRPPPPGYI